MNKLFLVFLLFTAASGYAQKSITYFTKDDNVTDSASSYFYSVTTNSDTVVSYYTASKVVRSREIYNVNSSLGGMYIEYHENGRMKIKGTYFNGMRIGIFMYWHADGKPYMTLQFPSEVKNVVSKWSDINYKIINYWDSLGNLIVKNGEGFCNGYFSENNRFERIWERGKVEHGLRDSVWTGTVDDKIVIHEVYKDGEFVNGVRFESGREIAYTNFETSPEYNGGLEAMARFIGKAVKYPTEARKKRIQGSVVTEFMIHPDGHLSDFKIVQSVYQSLDEEAIRVLKLTEWVPATYRGKNIKYKVKFPVKFKLAS